MTSPDANSIAQMMDSMLTIPKLLPNYLVRTAGPLSRDDALQVRALTEQVNDLYALLQDQEYWTGYVRRNGWGAAKDLRVNIATKIQKVDEQLYPLQNPGAPSIFEQGGARSAELEIEHQKQKGKTAMAAAGMVALLSPLILVVWIAPVMVFGDAINSLGESISCSLYRTSC